MEEVVLNVVGRDIEGADLPELIVDVAVELGVDPSQEIVVLYDVVDVEALEALVRERSPDSNVMVSFNIWGLHFMLNSGSVIAMANIEPL